jgi:hypothetical protein
VRGARKFAKRINAINAAREARDKKVNLEPECEEIPESECEEIDDYSDEFDRNNGKYPAI